jgi:hypothetical protein
MTTATAMPTFQVKPYAESPAAASTRKISSGE